MRISDRYQSAVDRVGGASPVAKTAKTSGPQAAKSEDAASSILDSKFSAEAQALNGRAAGIEQLKKQIADGSFKVDADAIAQKLVGE